jgi:serine/threonine-protein kinase
MDNRAHEEEVVNDDELLFDRGVPIETGGARRLELDEPLTQNMRPPLPLPPPPARYSQQGRSQTPLPGSYSNAPVGGLHDLNPFRPGDVLAGRYVVERIAGRMGLGLVVHVRHVDLGQRLVLKCLPPEACRYPDSVARFLRGARAAMRLQSEHTARTIDAGRLASGAPYVVSEALSGCDLREVLRVRGAVTITEAVDFILQAAEALAEAHSYGLIHRNINLFTLFSTRRPDGSALIKVLDFGVAEALRADPMRSNELAIDATTVFGSNPVVEALACSSPEQLRSLSELDARTDIWALGAVLHELLAGSPVYQADTVPGLLAMIAADPPMPITSLRSDVPAGLEAVILRCLIKDREARFATVADLAVALKAFASPDTQHSVDRITRTLGRNTRPPPLPSYTSALVHVGPAASNAPAPPLTRAAPSMPVPLVWSTLLVAFGLVGGTIAGVLVATRTGLQGLSRTAAYTPAVMEQRVLAAQPAPVLAEPAPAPAPMLSASAPPPARVTPLPTARPPARTARAALRDSAPSAGVDRPPIAEAARAASEGDETSTAQPARGATPERKRMAPAAPASDSGGTTVATGKDLFDSMR